MGRLGGGQEPSGDRRGLPEGGTWAGFEIMVLLMVVSAGMSYVVIRRLMR
jgi:hypothetical protein